MGLIRYSCSNISGPHEPILTQFGLLMFFIMLHRYMVSKTLKSKKKFFCDVIASVLYDLTPTDNAMYKKRESYFKHSILLNGLSYGIASLFDSFFLCWLMIEGTTSTKLVGHMKKNTNLLSVLPHKDTANVNKTTSQ